MTSLRILLSIAAVKKWDIYQMDVKNTFLHGNLQEKIYMDIPQGMTAPPNTVCKLKKSLYGLKQSPRAWYEKISSKLTEENFHRCSSDHSIFTKLSERGQCIVAIYMDDILITGNCRDLMFRKHSNSVFEMKDLGIMRYFLGMEIMKTKQGRFLNQKKYIAELLEETGMSNVNSARTPLETNAKLSKIEGEIIAEKNGFQQLIGKLIYLTATHPDITYAVNLLSQFMHCP
ncbi:unnamed protein product [Victoria cruziana]